ncbi:MAG TPA: hypothetical protein VL359_20575 [bacterium]|nr:hypothetical protein [bacterium]
MNTPAPECPSCRVRMEEGHVLTKDNSGRLTRPHWFEGEAEKGGMFGFRVKGKRSYPVVSWRCPRCAWLLWFAPEEEPR